MQNKKLATTPLANHFKLTKEMCPKIQEEIKYMSRVFVHQIVQGTLNSSK
jgi:hypothetical protein